MINENLQNVQKEMENLNLILKRMSVKLDRAQ